MKLFSRICSGIALALLGIGFLLVSLGASKRDWTGIGATSLYHDSYEASYKNVDRLEVYLPVGYVYVSMASGDDILFEAHNIKEGSILEDQSGSLLNLDIAMTTEGFHLFRTEIPFQLLSFQGAAEIEEAVLPVFVLMLPEKFSGSVRIEAGYGSVQIEDAAMDSVEVVVNCGEIRTTGVTAAKADFECNMGLLQLHGSYQKLTGDVNLGAINAELEGRREDYISDVSCNFGSLTYDYNDSYGINHHHSEYESKHLKRSLELSCNMGAVEVVFLR